MAKKNLTLELSVTKQCQRSRSSYNDTAEVLMSEAASGELQKVWGGVDWTAARLKELRTERGLTVTQVGENMGGISHSRVVDLESARNDIKLSTLLRYCLAIGVELSDVMKPFPPLKECKISASAHGELETKRRRELDRRKQSIASKTKARKKAAKSTARKNSSPE